MCVSVSMHVLASGCLWSGKLALFFTHFQEKFYTIFLFVINLNFSYSFFLVMLKIFFQALSGVGETIQIRARILNNTALSAALNAQFLFQIGIFTAVPMVLGFILEQGFLRVCYWSLFYCNHPRKKKKENPHNELLFRMLNAFITWIAHLEMFKTKSGLLFDLLCREKNNQIWCHVLQMSSLLFYDLSILNVGSYENQFFPDYSHSIFLQYFSFLPRALLGLFSH